MRYSRLEFTPMRKYILIIVAGVLMTACQQNKGLNLQVKVDGLKKGTLYIESIQDTVLVQLDSIEVRGNKQIEFDVALDQPQMLYLHLDKNDENAFNDRLLFFAEQGQMSIRSTREAFENDAQVKGSNTDSIYRIYQEVLTSFSKRDIELLQLSIDPDYATKIDSISTLAASNERRKFLYVLNFALNQNNSILAPYSIVYDGDGLAPKWKDSVYQSLTDDIKNSPMGESLKALLSN